jgi:hypothetical protein
MTMVSRKRHSTHDTEQEPEAKVGRNSPKSKKERKPKKNGGTLRRDSKRTKTAGKYFYM